VTLGPQRIPSPAQYQDAIDELNRLAGSLDCDPLFIYGLDNLQLPLEAGRKSYTIGIDPAGAVIADWDVPRPQMIAIANVIAGSENVRYPLTIYTPQVWADISIQDSPAIPQGIYNDRAVPLSTISVYGQPGESMLLELYTWHLITSFAALTDAVVLPPGYEDALVLNLAVRLAPHFQRAVDPNVRADAQTSLMRLESINAPRPIAETGGFCGCGGGYNIYSDQ
jgi:hypothetical protein